MPLTAIAVKTAVSRAWARIPRSAKVIGGIILAALVALLLAYCNGRSDGKAAGNLANAKAETKVARKDAQASGKAADDRAAETIAINKQEEGARDAIRQAPDTRPSPAAVAHNCDRLRRAGKDLSTIPACRRP